MFEGLNAFPITPLQHQEVDERAYAGLIEYLADSGVDIITALGGTGVYAYLSAPERKAAARIAIRHAAGVPVLVGVGSLRTRDVLDLARDAQDIGAAGLLVGPYSYHELTQDEALGLYEDLAAAVDLPIMIYDNPGGSPFHFEEALLKAVTEIPTVVSVKTGGLSDEISTAKAELKRVRSELARGVSVSISGDATAGVGLLAGADAWCSVIAGILPHLALSITRAAQRRDAEATLEASARLQPLWDLVTKHGGSLRVVGTIAYLLGKAEADNLPLPIRSLQGSARDEIARVLDELDVHGA